MLRQRIIAIIAERGTASPSEIAAALGPQYESDRAQTGLRQTLGRMVRRRMLERTTEYGRYRVIPRGARNAASATQQMEVVILDFLRSVGGVARTKEILRGVPDAIGSYERRLLFNTLKGSTKFKQDFGRGIWNLDQAARDGLPLPGYWSAHEIDRSDPFITSSEAKDRRETHFFDVGTAFAEARADVSLTTVANQPSIRALLLEMSLKAPAARAEALARLHNTVRASLGESAPESSVRSVARERKDEIAVELYYLFELGDPSLHMVAPAAFYRDCAALFGVCPAKLSRGVV